MLLSGSKRSPPIICAESGAAADGSARRTAAPATALAAVQWSEVGGSLAASAHWAYRRLGWLAASPAQCDPIDCCSLCSRAASQRSVPGGAALESSCSPAKGCSVLLSRWVWNVPRASARWFKFVGRLGPRLGGRDLLKCNKMREICLAVHRMPDSEQRRLRRLENHGHGTCAPVILQLAP